MRDDVVAVIEAAYAVERTEREWLDGIRTAWAPSFDAGLGTLAHLYDASKRPLRILSVVGPGWTAADVRRVVAGTDDAYMERTFRGPPAIATASEIPGFDRLPSLEKVLAPRQVRDVLVLSTLDPSGIGCWFGAPLPKRRKVTASERALWSRVAAHLAAGLRLRMRLAAAQVTKRDGSEALLTPTGRVDYASGDAVHAAARTRLREAVLAVERARGRLRHQRTRAVEEWKALVQARWTLLDDYESDGKRFIVACTNSPAAEGPERLTVRERQVLGCALLGHPSKLIAYELGISPSTVQVLLRRAADKLGVRSRADLIARYEALVVRGRRRPPK